MGGLGVKVQHFPLTLLVVLTTLTLPCERDKGCLLLRPNVQCQIEQKFSKSGLKFRKFWWFWVSGGQGV